MADVENDSPLLRFRNERKKFAIIINDWYSCSQLSKCMRENIPWSQVFHEEFFNRQGRSCSSKINHDRNICNFPRLYRTVYRIPFPSCVVRYFNPNDFFMAHHRHGCHLRIHIVEILFIRPSAHPFANNV